MPFKYRLPRLVVDLVIISGWIIMWIFFKFGWKEFFILLGGMLWIIIGTLIGSYMEGVWNLEHSLDRISSDARNFRAIGKILRGDFIDADKN